MSDLIKIAVDAMGGDNSPNKIIDGLKHHHKKNKNVFIRFLVTKLKSITLLLIKLIKNFLKLFIQQI
jgi:glycerol-3-phosphate acyltransferase PlsX